MNLFIAKSTDSALYKHVRKEHPTEANTEVSRLFYMKAVSSHKTNINRMAMEAILIEKLDPATLMNGNRAWS